MAKDPITRHSPMYCAHDREMPVQCPCDEECYCHVYGNCGKRAARQAAEEAAGEMFQGAVDGYEIIPVYTVYRPTENILAPELIGHYSSKGAALLSGNGAWGANLREPRIDEGYGIRIGTSSRVFLLKEVDPIDLDKKKQKADEELRQKTLASLTDEQKRVLGIKE